MTGRLGKAFVVWLVLIGAEFLHGVARAVFLVPYVGDFRSRQIGVFTGSAIIFIVAYVLTPRIGARTTRALLSVGTFWLGLTLLFEIGLGRFVFGYSWERLLEDYNFSRGGLLLGGMAFLTASPLIAMRLRRWRS